MRNTSRPSPLTFHVYCRLHSGEKKGNESADTSSEVCAEHCSAVLEWKTEDQC